MCSDKELLDKLEGFLGKVIGPNSEQWRPDQPISKLVAILVNTPTESHFWHFFGKEYPPEIAELSVKERTRLVGLLDSPLQERFPDAPP